MWSFKYPQGMQCPLIKALLSLRVILTPNMKYWPSRELIIPSSNQNLRDRIDKRVSRTKIFVQYCSRLNQYRVPVLPINQNLLIEIHLPVSKSRWRPACPARIYHCGRHAPVTVASIKIYCKYMYWRIWNAKCRRAEYAILNVESRMWYKNYAGQNTAMLNV
jgi:hypothetical protein